METQTTSQALQGESRVLLLAPPAAVSDADLCTELLQTGRPRDQHVLEIAYNRSPATVVENWRASAGELPASLAIICPEAEHVEEMPEGVHVTSVADSDLTGVGIAVTRYLDRWDGSSRSITACLDSLTAVLQYADMERVFRFLHTLNGRFVATETRAHVHLDPATQDDQSIATLATLFDTVVSRDGDDWVVES
jgi:hypothetical protein